jgi:hypothetical protein
VEDHQLAKLSREELALLDFLCASKHHRCRVAKVKAGFQPLLRSLRYAGLVSFSGHEPSAWALADWRRRKGFDPLQEDPQTPDPKRIPDPADSPEPEASEDGGAAAARNAPAAPPQKRGNPSMADRAKRFDEQRTAPPKKAGRPEPANAMPGSALAAEIDQFLASDRAKGLSATRISWHVLKSPSGLAKLRRRKWVGPEVCARVRAFIDDPDPAAWKASYYKHEKHKKGIAQRPFTGSWISSPSAGSRVHSANPRSAQSAPRLDPTKPPPGYQSRPEPITIRRSGGAFRHAPDAGSRKDHG